MKLIFKYGVIFISGLMLSGCSFLSPVKAPPDEGYMINQVPAHVKKARHNRGILLIQQPDTASAYNTVRIAFTDKPYQISYYSYSHWAEAPADMFAALLAETMQKTHHYRAIITPPFTGVYNYVLRTQINELRIDYTKPHAEFNLNLQAQMLSALSGNVIASRTFKVSVPLERRAPYSAVIAANRASAIAMSELAAWCVKHTS